MALVRQRPARKVMPGIVEALDALQQLHPPPVMSSPVLSIALNSRTHCAAGW